MNNINTRKCSKCGEAKQLDAFRLMRTNPPRRCAWCAECERLYNRNYQRALSSEKRKQYREVNTRQKARRAVENIINKYGKEFVYDVLRRS